MRSITAGFVLCVFAMTAVGPSSASADEIDELKQMIAEMKKDYEARIAVLEKKIDELQSEQGVRTARIKEEVRAELTEHITEHIKEEMDRQTVSVDYVGRGNAPVGRGGVVVENPFGFGNVSLGGYFDMEYYDFDDTESTFRQHRWIINIGAQLAERLQFNSELEIEYGGPDTAGSDGEIHVEMAYVDYLIRDEINARAGALLVPFGRYNLYHDSDLQDLTDRPLVARDIIPTTWTEAGAGFFGSLNPTLGSYEDLEIDYEVYAVNGLDGGFSDTGLRGARSSLKTDNNDNKAIVGRINFSPALGHELAFSGYYGEYDGTGNAISGGAVDSLNRWGPLELITEYAYFDIEETPTATSDLSNFMQGAYAQLNYHFWPEFLNNTFLGRSFEDPTLTLVGRYGWALIHDDGDATTGDNEERRTTIGLNYRPTDSFVVKFEYQINDTDNEALERGDKNGFVTSVAMGF